MGAAQEMVVQNMLLAAIGEQERVDDLLSLIVENRDAP
jgi:hypothetical protein